MMAKDPGFDPFFSPVHVSAHFECVSKQRKRQVVTT